MERYSPQNAGTLDRAVRVALRPLDAVTSTTEAIINNPAVLSGVDTLTRRTHKEAKRVQKLLKRALGLMAIATAAYLIAQCTPYQEQVNTFVSQAQHITQQPDCATQQGNPSLLICH